MLSELFSSITDRDPRDLQKIMALLTGDEHAVIRADDEIGLMTSVSRALSENNVPELVGIGYALGLF